MDDETKGPVNYIATENLSTDCSRIATTVLRKMTSYTKDPTVYGRWLHLKDNKPPLSSCLCSLYDSLLEHCCDWNATYCDYASYLENGPECVAGVRTEPCFHKHMILKL